MKKFHYCLLAFLIQGCSTTYHYYPVAVNAPSFANKGEVQFSGGFGFAGFNTMGGFAVTDNISVAGLYNAGIGLDGYYVKEGEASLGWSSPKNEDGKVFGIYGGYGWGNSYDLDSGDVVKGFDGSFSKPFLIFNFGSAFTEKQSFVRGDANIGLKFNYFMYSGIKNKYENSIYVAYPFNPESFLYELYFNSSIGGKYVRFQYGMGFAFKGLLKIGEEPRIFPMTMNIGMLFIIGRKYQDTSK